MIQQELEQCEGSVLPLSVSAVLADQELNSRCSPEC